MNGSAGSIPTGFRELDDICGGLRQRDLAVLAGQASTGKLAFVSKITAFLAIAKKLHLLMLCSEDAKEEHVRMILSVYSGAPYRDMLTGNLDPKDWPKLVSAAGGLCETEHFHLAALPSLGISTVADEAKKCKAKHGIQLLIIDDRQPDNKPTEKNNDTILFRKLKKLAVKLDLAVVLMRPQPPSPEDGTEQTADMIILIDQKKGGSDPYAQGEITVEARILRNRQGTTGKVSLNLT